MENYKNKMKNRKIIQLTSTSGNQDRHACLFALTEDGRVFRMLLEGPDDSRTWYELPTTNFVKRDGNLI